MAWLVIDARHRRDRQAQPDARPVTVGAGRMGCPGPNCANPADVHGPGSRPQWFSREQFCAGSQPVQPVIEPGGSQLSGLLPVTGELVSVTTM